MAENKNKTVITAEPGKQELFITREFDAPRELVFRAHTDPDIYVKWLGPRDLTTNLETFEPRNGGRWRFSQKDKGGNVYKFHGVYHEVTAPERIIGTFEFEGLPEPGHVALETAIFEALPGNRHDHLPRHGGDRIADAAARLVHGAELRAGARLVPAEKRGMPFALVLQRQGGGRAAVDGARRAERHGGHVVGGVLAVGVDTVDHVLQEHDRLRALVGLELGGLHLELQLRHAEQADREQHDRDQHLQHAHAALESQHEAAFDTGRPLKSTRMQRCTTFAPVVVRRVTVSP